MLSNKHIITIDGKYKLKFTYRTLKNIYDMTKINPFTYIKEFFSSNEKDKYLGRIIFALSNAEIQITDVYTKYLLSDEDKLMMVFNLINLINAELINEFKNDIADDEINENVSENVITPEQDLEGWIQYWNYCYSTATIILHKSEEEFLDMSPREFKTLDSYISNYYKSVLISSYVEIVKATNKNNADKAQEDDVEDLRLSRVFASM